MGDGILTPIYDTTSPSDQENGWTAKARLGEHWYLCAQCKRPFPKSKTTTATMTQAQRNKRVCLSCLDQPGRDDLREDAIARLNRAVEGEAESFSKENP